MAKFVGNNLPFEHFKIGPGKPKKIGFFASNYDRNYFKNTLKNLQKTRHSYTLNSGKKAYHRGQNSYVNATYLRNKYPNQWAAHGRYLQRKGAQKENEIGLGFNAERNDIPIAKLLNLWQEKGDERLWKFIISPEASDRIDLKEHATKFMENLQNDLGRKLEWVAIDHYNTDQFHLHLCIRGVDHVGSEFHIEKSYVKEGARKISTQLLTEKLGLRTDEYMLERREKVINLKHVTELDRIIEKELTPDNFFITKHGQDKTLNRELQRQITERLGFLESLGLAQKYSAASWHVEPTFLDYLKFIQEQNDVLKLLNKHKEHLIDKDLPLFVNKFPNVGDMVIGRVVGSGVSERNEDFRYIFVEGVDGRNHYITADTKITKLRDKRELLYGDIIAIEKIAYVQEGIRKTTLKVEAFDDFEAIKLSNKVNNVDNYIIEKFILNGIRPDLKPTDNAVRQKFLEIVEARISYLKTINILNDKLEVNFKNLENHLKRKI